ncbi:MAG TPA: hypothetical protein PLY45_01675 [bacterium]|nr:hypothetical protein [bacterium]
MTSTVHYPWRFFRAGGVDQVVLTKAEDISMLRELDQKLWVALACPTKGTEIDEKTLNLIDGDHDGRVRVPEILAAVEWLDEALSDLDVLFEAGDALPLSVLDETTERGAAVLASAKRILSDQGRQDADSIGLMDVMAVEQAFVATRFNGDGVVPAESAEDEPTQKAVTDLLGTVGSVMDRSGKPGVDQKLVDTFFEQATALLAWEDEGRTEAIHPLGDNTAAAADALDAVEAKLADYFARCRIAAYDARATAALNVGDTELLALSGRSLTLEDGEVAKLPLARVEPGRALPLRDGQNPAWAARLARFASDAVTPLLGERATLSESELQLLVDKLRAFREWRAKRPEGVVASLGLPRLRELVSGGLQEKLSALVAQDAALEKEYSQIAAVEKAVRLRRDLLTVLRNFVSFADFYARQGAVFQAGTLYLDGRACDLVVYVNDAAKHAALAGLSKAYLAYCECTRGAEKVSIVAAFTAGDVDNLMVGRNGVFYDRKGRDWDARITNLIENPISIRQAFWSPYKRLVRMIEEQVAKRAAEKEKASSASIDKAAASAATADQTPAAPAAAGAATPAGAPPKKMDIGVVAAVGVAVAGAATFLSSVLAMFLGLGIWMPVGLLAVLLAISAPSMLIAWLKLRQRNLGPILDANGWAINGLVRINVPFGGSLTTVAKLPQGAKREVNDPYAEKPTRWWLWLLLLLLAAAGVLWSLGKLDRHLPTSVKAATLLHSAAPAAPAAPAVK